MGKIVNDPNAAIENLMAMDRHRIHDMPVLVGHYQQKIGLKPMVDALTARINSCMSRADLTALSRIVTMFPKDLRYGLQNMIDGRRPVAT